MYNFTKRAIDILVAVIILVVSLPVFLVIMLLLALTGEGDVFYFQERIGYKNRKFYIIKFATLIRNAHQMGTGEFTVANDPRLRPFGKFLRKTKLNELPQAINILKGDMTLVGPRPLMDKGFARYSKEVQEVIYNIKPGLTGIGSIMFRDEVKLLNSCTDFDMLYRKINHCKGKLELWYQTNKGVKTDFLILFLTAYTILIPDQKLIYKVFKGLPELNLEENFNMQVRTVAAKRPVRKEIGLGV